MLLLQLAGTGLAMLTLFCFVFHKNHTVRGVSGALLSLFSVILFAVFLNAYYASGGPDAGKEWMQIFFPGFILMVLFAAGGIGLASALQKREV